MERLSLSDPLSLAEAYIVPLTWIDRMEETGMCVGESQVPTEVSRSTVIVLMMTVNDIIEIIWFVKNDDEKMDRKKVRPY